jgi:hypothetical protein
LDYPTSHSHDKINTRSKPNSGGAGYYPKIQQINTNKGTYTPQNKVIDNNYYNMNTYQPNAGGSGGCYNNDYTGMGGYNYNNGGDDGYDNNFQHYNNVLRNEYNNPYSNYYMQGAGRSGDNHLRMVGSNIINK